MSICDDELAATFTAIAVNFAWRCEALPGGERVAITTSRTAADSEPVTIYATLTGDLLTVSDGGETLNRLADASFDVADPALSLVWGESLRTYRVNVTEGRVFIQTRLAEAPYNLSRFADALVALDGLRVIGVPPASRSKSLADEVADFLADRYESKNLKRKPQIKLGGGVIITPAFAIDTPARTGVLVQPGSSTSATQSYDHAHTTMSLARRGGIEQQKLLVVLGGSIQSWNVSRLRALADLSFVGFWQDRTQVNRFLDGETPDDPLMVPAGVTVPLDA